MLLYYFSDLEWCLILSFGIGLYICAVVLFLRLGVVFDFVVWYRSLHMCCCIISPTWSGVCFCRLVSVSTYVLLYYFSDLEWCLILSFGIGLYICAVVLFLRLGVVFDFVVWYRSLHMCCCIISPTWSGVCFCRLVSVSTYVLLYYFSDLEWCLILIVLLLSCW